MPASFSITKIELQRNDPRRKSVFINGKFAFGAEAELISDFNLEENKSLTPAQLKQILWAIDRAKLKERALRLLSIRPRSEKELKEKLRLKGAGLKLIEDVISDLKEKELIDDQKFAYSWASSRISNKPMGKFLLKQELFKKGIKKETIDQVINDTYKEEEELELARTLLLKKSRIYKNWDDLKTKKRMADLLLRRGFPYEVVKQAVKGLKELSQ